MSTEDHEATDLNAELAWEDWRRDKDAESATTSPTLSVTYMTGDRRSVFLYRHKASGKFLYVADFTTHTGRHIELCLVDAVKATQFARNNLLAVDYRVRAQLLREFDELAFEWVEAEVFTSIFVKRK